MSSAGAVTIPRIVGVSVRKYKNLADIWIPWSDGWRGHPGRDAAFVGRPDWDADGVRDDLRD